MLPYVRVICLYHMRGRGSLSSWISRIDSGQVPGRRDSPAEKVSASLYTVDLAALSIFFHRSQKIFRTGLHSLFRLKRSSISSSSVDIIMAAGCLEHGMGSVINVISSIWRSFTERFSAFK